MKIDYDKFARTQNKLLKKDSTSGKREFLERFQASDSENFHEVFAGWGLDEKPKFILPKEKWEDDVFKSQPFPEDLEEVIRMFAGTPLRDLSRAATWHSIHIRMVREGAIDKYALAFSSSGEKDGYNSVRQALANAGKLDGCVRNILRHMGGVLKDRGNRSVFLDCPTAAFYWRCRFALDVIETYKKEPKSVYQTLAQSSVWEPLIEGIVSRMTIIGEARIRPALIVHIAEILEKQEVEKDVKGWVQDLRSRVGKMSLVRHLGFLESQEVLATFKEELGNQLD